ncbi:TetR/AcrR family transcriptional regulator C-terminal domain-containing protein [Polaromonas sp.]|uniref:TetR/AcrR family transcriptional regulator C-terminal domain-containing protein n=1 Tax=Polaromonas sp. TaxID=1869339 RepID=UPI0025CBD646|nr:TetR/AcrR family transcriptional regulator C-terminal domain-containing protein [Polaromonas sp.]
MPHTLPPETEADARAMREPGRRMRSHLLDIAVELFKSRGLSGVSVAEIAQAADAFPSQVTYYFRTKEALFVEAACREILYTGEQAEHAAAQAGTLALYTRALAESVVASPGLALFIEALTLARRRQDLAPLIERTFERLHNEGDRAYAAIRDLRHWPHDDDPALRARRFWALALGSVLRGAATGVGTEVSARDMLALLSDDTAPQDPPANARPQLQVVKSAAKDKHARRRTRSS